MRDLSSSRTPEASIAAALSRDTVLFERTAPSTYCVRPQFRKDSEDADEILSAAKERIRLFRSGLVDGEEEADKDGDEADREEYEESEGQDVDDVEVLAGFYLCFFLIYQHAYTSCIQVLHSDFHVILLLYYGDQV